MDFDSYLDVAREEFGNGTEIAYLSFEVAVGVGHK